MLRTAAGAFENDSSGSGMGHGKTRGFAVIPMRREGWKLGSPWGDGKGKVDWRLSETEGAGLLTTWMWLCWVGWAWGAEGGMSLEELVSGAEMETTGGGESSRFGCLKHQELGCDHRGHPVESLPEMGPGLK